MDLGSLLKRAAVSQHGLLQFEEEFVNALGRHTLVFWAALPNVGR